MKSMRTPIKQASVEPMLDRVQAVVDRWNRSNRRLRLRLIRDEFVVVDEWMNVVVQPEKPGTRALTYLDALEKIQAALESDGIEGVMVVPTYA